MQRVVDILKQIKKKKTLTYLCLLFLFLLYNTVPHPFFFILLSYTLTKFQKKRKEIIKSKRAFGN